MTRLELTFPSQAAAFSAADAKGWNCFYKVFPQGKHMYGICPNNKGLARLILRADPEDRTYQELMRDGQKIATYWDIDAEYDSAPTDVVACRKTLITAFEGLLATAFPDILREAFRPHFMRWSDSSGAYKGGWKLSLHAVYADPELGWLHCHSNGASNARQCLN